MPLFILAIIVLMLSADLWWWWRADRALRPPVPHSAAWRAGLAVFMATAVGGLVTIIVSRTAGFAMPAWLIAGLFIWHFLVLPVVAIPSLLLAIVSAPARFFNGGGSGGRGGEAGEAVEQRGDASAAADLAPVPAAPSMADVPTMPVLSRRGFLAASLAAAPPLVTVISTGRAMGQLDEFRVRRITVPVAGLPADLDGMTIAHVSDVHVGSFTHGPTLDRIAEAVSNLRADLVLQTGDLINNSVADLPAGLEMSRKFDARYGEYLVEGNHDLFQGRLAFERRVRDAGLPLLLNESAEVRVRGAPVQILGLRWGYVGPDDDPRARPRRNGGDGAVALSMRDLLPQRRDDAFQILLAHHPHAFDLAAEAGIPLTLAGHTHGGQLHLTPGIGFGPWMYRYWSGLYRKQRSSLVVSNGAGNWFPLRINAPAEIVHLTLRREQA